MSPSSPAMCVVSRVLFQASVIRREQAVSCQADLVLYIIEVASLAELSTCVAVWQATHTTVFAPYLASKFVHSIV